MYASLFKRLIAAIIDSIILGIIGGSLAFFLGGKGSLLYQAVILLGYFSYFEQSQLQGSFGKYLMKIRIVTTEGETISWTQAILRNIVKLFALGFILALFSSKKRALHDLVAGTIAVEHD